MRDTLRIECFLEALSDYLDAKAARDAARYGYEGSSWGYFGYSEENRVAQAAAQVEDKLAAVIRSLASQPTTGEGE